MKANSKHISLETAKLLKDCGVPSNNHFSGFYGFYQKGQPDRQFSELPAYTWEEILWDNAECFFEEIKTTRCILELLQKKKYDEADLFFRVNTILIKQKQ